VGSWPFEEDRVSEVVIASTVQKALAMVVERTPEA